MPDEMNRPEAELNEAALTGVSGGLGTSEHAAKICNQCKRHVTCSHFSDLFLYLVKNGISSVSCPQRCPYFNE